MRKISPKLLDRLKSGDLKPLLNYIQSDPELRLEVRRNGDAFVYYRKGKALEIKNLKVDKKYGNVPPTELAVSNPASYLTKIKQSIDNWLEKKKNRAEFDTQQNIATQNQYPDDKYIIIDMEYAFEQHKIPQEDRYKQATFDLVGVERTTGKVILFEVKTGLGAIKVKSGVDDHIKDFETILQGKNSEIFKEALFRDIENIVSDKKALGLITNFDIPSTMRQHEPELIFVFHPLKTTEIEQFEKELKNRKECVFVSGDNFKLK